MLRLKDAAEIVMGQAPDGSTYNEVGEGLPLIAGAGDFGDLYPSPKKFTTAPNKKSKKNDIILCIRATIGDLNLADREYALGRGVAGITPRSKVDKDFLWYWLKGQKNILLSKGKGATFLQITKSDLEDLEIVVPELSIQKEISQKLRLVDSLLEKRRQSLAKLDQLAQSIFLDMFGDPVTNPKNWSQKKLSEVGTLARGKSKHRPRNAPELFGGPYPFIQTGDITNAHLFVEEYEATYSEIGLKQSKLWPKDTLAITIAANIAFSAIIKFESCFPDSVAMYEPGDKLLKEYVMIWLSFLQKSLEDSAPQSAQKNINLGILSDLKIPLPDIRLQKKFQNQFYAIYKLRQKLNSGLVELEILQQSLSQKFFGG